MNRVIELAGGDFSLKNRQTVNRNSQVITTIIVINKKQNNNNNIKQIFSGKKKIKRGEEKNCQMS